MKKLAVIGLMLLLVLCGCGKAYTLQQQQVEFSTWSQGFQQKIRHMHEIEAQMTQLLARLRDQEISAADADAQYKQLSEQVDQTILSLNEPPKIKTLSQADTQALTEASKDSATALGYFKKIMGAALEATKSSDPSVLQRQSNNLSLMRTSLENATVKLTKVANKLKVTI